MSWIYPGPPPQEPEPTAEQRRDYAGFPNAAVIDTVGPDGSPRRHTIVTYSKNIDVVMPYVSAAAVIAPTTNHSTMRMITTTAV